MVEQLAVEVDVKNMMEHIWNSTHGRTSSFIWQGLTKLGMQYGSPHFNTSLLLPVWVLLADWLPAFSLLLLQISPQAQDTLVIQ